MTDRKADLHIHTTSSDGAYPANTILSMARERGIQTISITDHDTVGAYQTPLDDKGVRVIPGIELSSTYDSRSVHILGYFIDTNNSQLLRKLESLREGRARRALKIVEKLHQHNVHLNEACLGSSNPGDSVGRVHLAREMVRLNYVKSVSEAFALYLGDEQCCYVPNQRLNVPDACALIHQSGGISVLAHPGLIQHFTDYDALIAQGLEGVEVFHPKHSDAQRNFFFAYAVERGLLITGGSDFHSKDKKSKLGQAYLSGEYLQRLFDYEDLRRENIKDCQ